MRTLPSTLLLLAVTTILVPTVCRADDLTTNGSDRFKQARNRTFRSFNAQAEQSWQGPYFFLQLADTQYGMFTGNTGFEKEAALAQQAVEHINRLRPRYVIVCGDLTNATPLHARYDAQVTQYKRDFSAIDEDIPLVCVCGNHDIGNRPTPKSIAIYKQNFGDDYFAFWVGGVCNIVLNSSVLKDPSGAPGILAAQHKWLDLQLAAARKAEAKHIFVFQHHPLFLTQPDEADQYFNIPLVRRTPLVKKLRQSDVRAVFAGHYHRNSHGQAGAMEMITTGPVGKPFGKDVSGFRIVTVHEDHIRHQYYGLDDVPQAVDLQHREAKEPSPATNENCFGFTSSDPGGLRNLLRYTASHATLISAHRGGAQQGFPENCIATFQHSLQHGCTMLEVDPRLTRDGQIVLHHDSTLDRTTSGSGLLKQKTLAELKQLTLTDLDGNPTKYQMPTLEETIQWSRGKTVLVLDQKDVPLQQRIDAITKHDAESFVMLIISSMKDATQVHQSNPNIMMELFVSDMNRVQQIDQSGIPWDRIIAFVGHKPPTDKPLIDAIHQRGAMCMAGTSRHLDKELSKQGSSDIDLRKRYRDLIAFGIDVIETDLPIQVHQVLK